MVVDFGAALIGGGVGFFVAQEPINTMDKIDKKTFFMVVNKFELRQM
jgi:uncharacterized membrane protein YsdA (DUF1294 family)